MSRWATDVALTERLAIILETVGTAPVVRDFKQVGNASEGIATHLRTVGTEATGMGGLVQAGALAAAGAIVAFATKSVDAYYDMAQSVLAFQRASGASAEQASALVAAFDDVGISAEVGAKAIFQLGKRLEENGTKLSGYGVSAVRGADGNVDLAQTLKSVADAYVNTTDPAQRAALVTAAFGKAGQQLIPILERGRQGIDELYASAAATNQILTQDEIQKADDFRMAIDDLNDAWKQFEIESGKALVPLLTDLAKAATTTGEWIDKLKIIPALKWLAGLDDSFEGAADSTAGLALATQKHAEESKEQADAVADVEKAVLASSNAQHAYEASTRAVASADRNLADARKDYNKLLAEGAVDEEKVADARRSLGDATRSMGHAQRELSDAQGDYNDALAFMQAVGGDTAADKLADASDNLADAQDGVASAQERQQGARDDLAKAQAGDPEFNDKLAAAKQRVKDAEQGFADAQYNSSQRAYELDGALKTQDGTLATNEAAVEALRAKWAELLGLKPEIVGFLQGSFAAVGASAAPTGLLTGPASGSLSPVTTTNTNNTFNITASDTIDPMNLARNIVWNLN